MVVSNRFSVIGMCNPFFVVQLGKRSLIAPFTNLLSMPVISTILIALTVPKLWISTNYRSSNFHIRFGISLL